MDGDLVRALRARGVDVEPANEVGMIEREDAEHLTYATAQCRVIIVSTSAIFVGFMPNFRPSSNPMQASSWLDNSDTALANRCVAYSS
jgi:hypothetical protein